MTLNSWFVVKFHQTPLSRALRDSWISPLAEWWWKRYQSGRFHSALRTLGFRESQKSQSERDSFLSDHDLPQATGKITDDGDEFRAIMATYCSTSKFRDLGYQDIYAALLMSRRYGNGVLLEIGIGHNDPRSPSGMSAEHNPGASLVGWANFLPYFEIHGADVRPEVLVDTDAYRTHYVDQRRITSLCSLASKFPAGLDVVIDDGLHTPEANANVVSVFVPLLRPGGFLMIEDIQPEFDELWHTVPDFPNDSVSFHFYPGSTLRGSRPEGLALFLKHK